ncbi:MAG: UbiA family prenyltransferase, partial [Paracoccus sp. (in: a-proteobacteria)]
NWGVLLAYAAHAGRLDPAPVAAWLGGIAWTIFYDTIYAHQDAEDDALIGVKSTALLFGENSPTILLGFAGLSVVLLALAIVLTGEGPVIGSVIGLIGLAGFAAHLMWQWSRLDPKDNSGCTRLFRSNRDAGLILALFLAIAGLV